MNQYTKIAMLTVLAITLSAAVTARAQPAQAFAPGSCSECAKDFAPGQEAKNSDQSANTFALGQEKKSIGGAPCWECDAPGQEKKQGTTTSLP